SLQRMPGGRSRSSPNTLGPASLSSFVMRRRAFIVALMALAGCHTAPKRRGDLASAFLAEIRARGGRTLPVDRLPKIESRWSVERDEFGFQFHVFDSDFTAVDSLLTKVLGTPKISVSSNADGHPQRMYDSAISGM